jgi:hypothetical protein
MRTPMGYQDSTSTRRQALRVLTDRKKSAGKGTTLGKEAVPNGTHKDRVAA